MQCSNSRGAFHIIRKCICLQRICISQCGRYKNPWISQRGLEIISSTYGFQLVEFVQEPKTTDVAKTSKDLWRSSARHLIDSILAPISSKAPAKRNDSDNHLMYFQQVQSLHHAKNSILIDFLKFHQVNLVNQ